LTIDQKRPTLERRTDTGPIPTVLTLTADAKEAHAQEKDRRSRQETVVLIEWQHADLTDSDF
jgi:hypothetical protein